MRRSLGVQLGGTLSLLHLDSLVGSLAFVLFLLQSVFQPILTKDRIATADSDWTLHVAQP